jgi:cell division protease FtsH
MSTLRNQGVRQFDDEPRLPAGGPSRGQPPAPVRRPRLPRTALFWLGFILVVLIVLNFVWKHLSPSSEEITVAKFTDLWSNRPADVAEITVRGSSVEGKYADPKAHGNHEGFYLRVPPGYWTDDKTDSVAAQVRSKLKFEREDSVFMTILATGLPYILLIIVGWWLLFRFMRSPGAGGGVLSFGKSRAHLHVKEHSRVTFDDVAGVDEAKDEVREIIEFLKSPARFARLGGRIPRGVILIGPPGCGKTLLAKAIAGEADVPFFSISGSDFVEMFVGVGASRVRDLFKQAKDNSPCIVFLDEVDAVGRRRGAGLGGGHDEREQTLNAILVEMDGFESDEGVIVVAATNRPDVLDPALLRPGRFDREIVIDLPDVKGRLDILKVHASKVKTAPSADLEMLARATPTFSGADLAAIINEAALAATLRNKDAVDNDDLMSARDKVRWGREKRSRVMDDDDKRVIAYHETGHAVLMQSLPDVDPVDRVSIIPRGMALGVTMHLPMKDRYIRTKRNLVSELVSLYGGRVAEELFIGDVSSGAAGDIEQATELARKMVCDWGMSEAVGLINYANKEEHIFLGGEILRPTDHSDATAQEIDREVKNLLDAAYRQARELLESKRDAVERVADALLKYETLTGAEVNLIIKGEPLTRAAAGETKTA